jgi:hypothetical protein
MSARSRRLVIALAALVLLLFAGRWTALVLADRWWAEVMSPAAASFLTGLHLLRLTLDASAVLFATAWFTGHLVIVQRAIGSVQVPRHLANLEIREALTPSVLLPAILLTGSALGLAAGLGASDAWNELVLAWHGVRYGVEDPYLHRDLGLYVAQLPAWRAFHGFALLLVGTALAAVALLYVLVGAIRRIDGRPAINDHARRHLGLLFTALALVLAWGYWLEPFEAAAYAGSRSHWPGVVDTAHILIGAALAAACLSVIWTLRPRHLLALSGWLALAIGSIMGHRVIPALRAPSSDDGVSAESRLALNRIAYTLTDVRELASAPAALPTSLPGVALPWDESAVARLAVTDSAVFLAAGLDTRTLGPRFAPAWVAVRAAPGGPPSVTVIAEGRINPRGEPYSFRAGDTLAYPGVVTFASLPDAAIRPSAPRLIVDTASPGVQAGRWAGRALLAWALQDGRLLASVPPQANLRWHLAPRDRLEQLAPFVEWEVPRPVLAADELYWIATGYVSAAGFPGSARLEFRGREIGAIEAGFVGAIHASTGETRIVASAAAGPISRAWAALAGGVVLPVDSLPITLRAHLDYPTELFQLQARVLEDSLWAIGRLAGRTATRNGEPQPPGPYWDERSKSVGRVAGYQGGGDRRLQALLLGLPREGGLELQVVRLDTRAALPGMSTLEGLWSRFPLLEQIGDSVRRAGDRFERGPLRLIPWEGGVLALQVWYGVGPAGRVTVPWVAMAAPERLGAGRTIEEAWSNLRGETGPLPPGLGPKTPFEEARAWMLRADSALHAGDWEAFGRAFGALRRTLGVDERPR